MQITVEEPKTAQQIEAEAVSDAAFAKASSQRASVMASLRDWPKTTGQVALACGLSAPHASRSIRELVDRGLLVCQTPDLRGRGKLYGLTATGGAIAKALEHEGRGLQMTPLVRVTQPQAWYEALNRRFGREKARETLAAVGLGDSIDEAKRQWVPLHSQLKLLEEIERRFGDGS